jgi:TonB dependent receptor
VSSSAFLLIASAFFAMSSKATAQAWVPPRGAGSITTLYQRISYTGHRLTDGSVFKGVQSTNMALYVEVDYSLTKRLSFSAGLPYVFAKYTDPNPPPSPIPYLPVDECHCWNRGWQDFGFTTRYNLAGGAFALTPSVSVGVPSHSYDFRGEAVLGRHLKEVRIAIDAGQRLDALSPNMSVQGRYSYAFVERVIDVGNNRSNASFETTYLLTRKLAAHGSASWQHTHGGLRFGAGPGSALVFPGEANTPERLFQHDRLLRDNYWRVGGGATYSFPQMDVFASFTTYVAGTDAHTGRALTFGISWPFQLGAP